MSTDKDHSIFSRQMEDIGLFMYLPRAESVNDELRFRALNFIHLLLLSIRFFAITAEIHARSLVNFYCQYADRHMNLKFIPRFSERERAIRQFGIVKNKLMSVFNAPALLSTMNFVITLST